MTIAYALFLAALLCAPLALLLMSRDDGPSADRPGGDAARGRGPALDAVDAPTLRRWYGWAVWGVAAWLVVSTLLRMMDLQHTIESLTLIAIVTAVCRLAPDHPLAGPTAFAVLNYTFGRDDTVTVLMTDLGGPSLVAALSVAAVCVWRAQRGLPLRLPRQALAWFVAAFAAWIAVTVLAALFAGRPVEANMTARLARYAQAVALFFVAAASVPTLSDVRAAVGTVAAALVVRQVFLVSYWLMEQNLAMLAVVTVPVAIAMAACRPFDRWQVALVPIAGYLAAMILWVQNRGAIVGLAAACLGMWPLARRRWTLLPVLLVVPAVVGAWAYEAGLLDRFRQVYVDGQFVGTAAERLAIWTGGFAVARNHLVFGVGPDNFTVALQSATDGRLAINAHNSYVELLAELGAPGLALYLLAGVAGLVQLVRVAIRHARGWQRTAAAGILGSLAAHAAAGTFLSNPSLVWTWTLLGLALALGASGAGIPVRAGGLDVPEQPAGQQHEHGLG